MRTLFIVTALCCLPTLAWAGPRFTKLDDQGKPTTVSSEELVRDKAATACGPRGISGDGEQAANLGAASSMPRAIR
jgi:hypothetical protein